MSARLAPSSRPLPLLFVAFLSFFVFPWPSPLRVINVIIIIIITRLLPRHPGARFPRGHPPDKSIYPGPPDTPAIDRHCLFPIKYHHTSYEAGPETITFEELQQALMTMAGTIVKPVDALMRFHHYTAHFPDDYDIDEVTVTALLKLSGASATDIRNFLSGLADDHSGLLTPSAPSPADSTSGGLGAQVATATARDTDLCGPSPISPRDALGDQVPTYSTTAHPVDQVRVQGAVMIETLPGGPTMLQGPSRGLCPAQTSGSPMTLKSASAAGSASKADHAACHYRDHLPGDT